MNKFKDMFGCEWEYFVDESYYHMWCVRLVDDRDFNSKNNYHFMSKQQMKQFIKILKGE